jgi:hypothetical protein
MEFEIDSKAGESRSRNVICSKREGSERGFGEFLRKNKL